LWICECKTSLLSVSKTVKEYEGAVCLQLLRRWQEEEDTADVVIPYPSLRVKQEEERRDQKESEEYLHVVR